MKQLHTTLLVLFVMRQGKRFVFSNFESKLRVKLSNCSILSQLLRVGIYPTEPCKKIIPLQIQALFSVPLHNKLL